MKKVILSLSILTVFLITAQIIYSCMLVGDGKMIRNIDNEITSIKNETILLAEKVASESSLLAISEKAKVMGFVEKPTVMTMHTDLIVAALSPSR